VSVRMVDGAFDYSWEYQGAAPRLVYTPLTDRAYLTLTQVRAASFVPRALRSLIRRGNTASKQQSADSTVSKV